MTERQLNKQRERIAALLKSRREYLQLTQEQVAERIGTISSRTIQRAETGAMWLGLKQFVMYCDALEWDVADILQKLNENAEL